MKIDYMQCWNSAMALLGAHKEAIIAIAGVFLFLPNLLFAQFVSPPQFVGDESFEAMMTIYSAYFNENSAAVIGSNLIMSFGGLAIYFALAPSRNHTVAENLGATLKAFLVFLLANLLTGLIVIPGLFLFLIPGFYLACRLILVPVVIANEGGSSPLRALKRSWELTTKNGFSIMLFILIIVIIGVVTVGVVGAVVGVLVGLATGGEGWLLIENMVSALTGTAFQLIVSVIIMAIYIRLSGEEDEARQAASGG